MSQYICINQGKIMVIENLNLRLLMYQVCISYIKMCLCIFLIFIVTLLRDINIYQKLRLALLCIRKNTELVHKLYYFSKFS